MDTPFSDHCGDIVVGVRIAMLLSDEPAKPHRYVFVVFSYVGNGSDKNLDGCCGGVVWTEESEPIGLPLAKEVVLHRLSTWLN